MKTRRYCSCLVLLLLAIAAGSVSFLAIHTEAQNPCPPGQYGRASWPANTTVYFDDTNLSSTQQSAISTSISSWNSANQSNGSGVSFVAASAQHPATLVFSNSPTPPPGITQNCTVPAGAAAQTCLAANPPNSSNEVSAAIVFNPSGTIQNTTTPIYDPNVSSYSTFVDKIGLHEIGHTMGLDNQPAPLICGDANTVMNVFCGTNDSGGNMAVNVTGCDNTEVNNVYPPPPPPPPSGGCTSDADCTCGGQCGKDGTCTLAYGCTPIMIAVGQTPDYDLTSPQDGVWFDLQGTGIKQRMSWTKADEPVGFLVWDRNGNGIIDNGSELFGNRTVLPNGQLAPNGFMALAAYDQPQNGGNGDGVIDAHDAIWANLRLWIDWNHNGFSEPSEIYTLDEFGITRISLDYTVTNRTDQYGNVFRLKSPCELEGKVRFGYDVYFSARPPRKPGQ